MTDPRAQLLDLLATLSFRLGDFTLSSGARSDYYIDCRTTTLHAEGARLAGLLFLDLIRTEFPTAQAIGGLTLGADPLVSAVSVASAAEFADFHEINSLAAQLDMDPEDTDEAEPTLIHGFLVRKAPKEHGTTRRIEGFLTPGAPVLILDDVCTTGGSTLNAIQAARDAGMSVLGALCLVDREQGGRAAIEEALGPKAPFHTLFTATDVRRAHLALTPDRLPAN